MIVDDHPTFRRFARRLLEEAGFDVVGEASEGEAALESVVELEPDIVLLDVMLPDVSGLEVAARLEQLAPSAHVVLVSSRCADDLGVAGRSGGPRFVRKDELELARLGELLGEPT